MSRRLLVDVGKQVVIAQKRYKIETWLVWETDMENRASDYRITPLLITFGDLQVALAIVIQYPRKYSIL